LIVARYFIASHMKGVRPIKEGGVPRGITLTVKQLGLLKADPDPKPYDSPL
jgi:hypothetical protein